MFQSAFSHPAAVGSRSSPDLERLHPGHRGLRHLILNRQTLCEQAQLQDPALARVSGPGLEQPVWLFFLLAPHLYVLVSLGRARELWLQDAHDHRRLRLHTALGSLVYGTTLRTLAQCELS